MLSSSNSWNKMFDCYWILDLCSSCRACISFFFFSSRRRHTRFDCDWSSDVCSSDLAPVAVHDERSPRRDQRNHGQELRQRDLRLVGVRDVVHHVVELPSGLCEPGDGGLGVRADDLQLADTIEPEPLAGNTHDERIALDHGDVPWGGETVEQVDLRAAAQADEQRGRSPGELDGVERLPPVFTAHRSPVAVERIDREDFTMNHEPALCAAVDHADPARQARPSSEDDARPLQLGAVTNSVPVTRSDHNYGRFDTHVDPAPVYLT